MSRRGWEGRRDHGRCVFASGLTPTPSPQQEGFLPSCPVLSESQDYSASSGSGGPAGGPVDRRLSVPRQPAGGPGARGQPSVRDILSGTQRSVNLALAHPPPPPAERAPAPPTLDPNELRPAAVEVL
ncbi:unnamed protein product [Rangifer tarandus platyrhynchus]|uniref:Uncharacterized protein n=1 Tax=Rangifer tarandus platyrhynchus TaxID=3082113 RepID=A0ABN8YCK4_RANTA|nr:unnamed protein product [Rangifer tarandus platyrhynchus]